MTDSVFKGFDINALMQTAGAQPQGQQKLRLCKDISDAIGANPIYEIQVGGVVKYRTTVSGALSYSSSGITLPTQFVEPPTINAADDLDGWDDSPPVEVIEVIRSVVNPSLQIETPLKSGGGAGFLTADKGLNGTYYVRTSSRVLVPSAALDASAGGGSTSGIYQMQTLIDDMTTANDNSWHLDAAPNTANTNGPGGTRYAQINIALRRADGRSHWPGEYLDDSAPQGVSLSDGTTVYILPWYVVGRAYQVTDAKANIRVQCRNMILRGLKSDNTWEEIASAENPMSGSSWHANFRSPGNETYEDVSSGSGFAQLRTHSDLDGGGASLGSIGYGDDGSSIPRRYKWTNHGYAAGTTKTRAQWVAYKGLTITMEARAILHDPNGVDNRSATGLLVWIGADWYKNSPSGTYINSVAVGRLKLVTGDWNLYSVSEQSMTDLENYPIDGYTAA